MAKVEIKMPEELLLKVSRLGSKTDEIVEKVLEAGGEVVLAKVKSNLAAVVGQGTKKKSRSTGELERSLGLSPVLFDRKTDGHNIKVGFNEPRKKQTEPKQYHVNRRTGKSVASRGYYEVTNAMIANILEYGRHGQPPRPFLKPARSASRKACIEAMKAKFEEEVNGL
jgi:HK97 gp10 family phage protein